MKYLKRKYLFFLLAGFIFLTNTSYSAEQIVSTSPFGIVGNRTIDELKAEKLYFKDLNIKWTRPGSLQIIWGRDEPQKGKYNWKILDRAIGLFKEMNITAVMTISIRNQWDQSYDRDPTLDFWKLPRIKMLNDEKAYRKYLSEVVRRYPHIKYYQIGNEPLNFWGDSVENFAKLIKMSYEVIKKEKPDAVILLPGTADPRYCFNKFMEPLLKILKKYKEKTGIQYFDIADFHWSGQYENAKTKRSANYRRVMIGNGSVDRLKDAIKRIRNTFEKYGFKDVPIWITEMSDYSGQPVGNRRNKYIFQSEKEQAKEIFKRYVYSIALGIEKIFWISIIEKYRMCGPANNYFDNVGLINNPLHDGEAHKKLSYYTYKLMLQELEGCAWKKTKLLKDENGIVIIKFIRNERPIWVIWNDNRDKKKVTISGIPAQQVGLIKAVCEHKSGEAISDYKTAFFSLAKKVLAGKISIMLDDIPVIIKIDKMS